MNNKLEEFLAKHGINKSQQHTTNRNKGKSANSSQYKKNPYTKSNWFNGTFTYKITPEGHLGECVYTPPKKVSDTKEYLNTPGPKIITKKK